MPSRLEEHYKQKVVAALVKTRGYKNAFEVPKIEKIVVSMGVSTATIKADKNAVEEAIKELTVITGQKPVLNRSKKNISNFNLRLGQEIGCRVTLRRTKMYEFFDRLVSAALPRIRDFRGLPVRSFDRLVSAALPRIRDFRGLPVRSFDGRGSYTFGVNDQTIFPEIELDKIKRQQGMHITIVTSARTNEEARLLLEEMGMPFATRLKPHAAAK